MEILLLIVAATYAISGKHQKDTSVAAYKAGKEPPGLVKARMRHEAGGGRFATRPGKNSTPKGPGATRLLIASRWANSCDKAKTRGEDKLKRWQAWYEEQAPNRDKQWRDKQRKKLEKRAERLDKWQGRWTRAKSTVASTKDADQSSSTGENTQGTDAGQAAEPAAAEPATPQPETPQPSAQTDTSGATGSGENAPSSPASSGTTNTPPTTTTTEGGAVYQQGTATMHNHADEVEGYEKALTALGQDLEAVGWGAEVHGPLADMHTKLQNVAARYRDLAENAKHQGDNVNDSYDEAPWAPDRAALTQ